MSELVRFGTGPSAIVVEVAENDYGVERVSRADGGVIDAGKSLQNAISGVQPTLEEIIKTVKGVAPKQWEIEFGIKLNAEAGVVVAKTAVEGHFMIKLSWNDQRE